MRRPLLLLSAILVSYLDLDAREVWLKPWLPPIVDMQELDVTLESLDVRLTIREKTVYVDYTARFIRDPSSWKVGQTDYQPRFFRFELPVVAPVDQKHAQQVPPLSLDLSIQADESSGFDSLIAPPVTTGYLRNEIRFLPRAFSYLLAAGTISIRDESPLPLVHVSYQYPLGAARRSKAAFALAPVGLALREAQTVEKYRLRFRSDPNLDVRAPESRFRVTDGDEECDCRETTVPAGQAFVLTILRDPQQTRLLDNAN